MSQKTICIIDDDPIYQLVTKKIIGKSNHFPSAYWFSNGWEAISFFKNSDTLPDIILLDLEMPLMDGWDFLTEISVICTEIRSIVSIYIVSSSISKEDKERAKTFTTVKGFISKPITLSKIELIANAD